MKYRSKKLKKLIMPVAAAISGAVIITGIPGIAFAGEQTAAAGAETQTLSEGSSAEQETAGEASLRGGNEAGDSSGQGNTSGGDSYDQGNTSGGNSSDQSSTSGGDSSGQSSTDAGDTSGQDSTAADGNSAQKDTAGSENTDENAGNDAAGESSEQSKEEVPENNTQNIERSSGAALSLQAPSGATAADTNVSAAPGENRAEAKGKVVTKENGWRPYKDQNGNVIWVQNGEGLFPDNLNRISDIKKGEEGWFNTERPLTFNERVNIKGDVNIVVIWDSSTLDFKKGINIEPGASLTIWMISNAPARVTATSNEKNLAAITVNEGGSLILNHANVTATTKTNDAAGIGGDKGKNAGNIILNRGAITATSQKNGAGIGGGMGGSGGSFTINSGTVTATSKGEDGAGIGGGDGGSGGTVTINGGTVTATGSGSGAGIGGGCDGSSGTITINGGKVTATGGHHGAGIGGGRNGAGDTITIAGGTVDAQAGEYAAGIGGGGDSGADKIIISGGKITTRGGTESAGIGSANKGHVNEISISGGDIIAIGANNAAGIGGGDGNENNGTYGVITISGEGTRVRAYGGDQAAGIGTGNDTKTNNGTINISDGADVLAVGSVSEKIRIEGDRIYCKVPDNGSYVANRTYEPWENQGDFGAGIGGGDQTPGGTINISGAKTKVKAYGGKYAAGIGSGDKAPGNGEINITGGNVEAWGGAYNPLLPLQIPKRGDGGAGIGGGRNGGGSASGKITISGQDTKINARGGEYASGIGGGDEGGFDTIIIKDGADVTSSGGKHGAGIGTGDVTDNGKKKAWKTGTIEITGENTRVQAFGGEDSAGIGGGQDGYGCNISISYVGIPDGSTGFVKAVGKNSAAGIGGGSNSAFATVNIDHSVVYGAASYGAGIGTGGGAAGKSSANPETGGEINIRHSAVVAVSSNGGAGIGGGIFGRAGKIDICGGTVLASGGAAIEDVGLPGFSALKADHLMHPSNFEADLYHTGSVFGAGDNLKGILNKAYDYLLGDTARHVVDYSHIDKYYAGAGIGGGYKAAGGEITIREGAAVSASAGVFPPGLIKNNNSNKMKCAAIGEGKDYSGSDTTEVYVYPEAAVTTGKLSTKPAEFETMYSGYYSSAMVLRTVDTVISGTQAGQATDAETMSRLNNNDYQLAVIQRGYSVSFNSDGGSEVNPQSIFPGGKAVRPEDPVKEGYKFRDWYRVMPDGTLSNKPYDFDSSVIEQINLQARWLVPVNKINIDEAIPEGDVLSSIDEAKEGKIIYISTTNENIKNIIVTDDLGNKIEVKKNERNTKVGNIYIYDEYSFVMPDTEVIVYADIAQKHNISIDEHVPDGAFETDYKSASAGTLVTITVHETDGFRWNEILVFTEDYNNVYVNRTGENTFTFKMPDSDVTIAADIYGNEAIVTFDSDGGSAVGDKAVTKGKTVDKPEDPVKEGYVFEGWYPVKDGIMADKPYDFSEPVNENITLKARWKKADANTPAQGGSATPSNRAGTPSSANVTRVTGGNTVTTATSAKTGDKTHLPAFIAIAAAGAAGMVGAIVARRRKKD